MTNDFKPFISKRLPFTDPYSVPHFLLGVAGGKDLAPWFLFYQFGIQSDTTNGLVDSIEYLAGWMTRSMFGETTPCGLGDGTPCYNDCIANGGPSGGWLYTLMNPASLVTGSGSVEQQCVDACTTVEGHGYGGPFTTGTGGVITGISTDPQNKSGFSIAGGSLNPLNPSNVLPPWLIPAGLILAAIWLGGRH